MSKLLAVVAALALVATACGDSGSGGGEVASLDNSGTLSPANTEDQLLDFAQCMRDQGVALPDPTVDAEGNPQLAPPDDFDPGDLSELLAAAEQCEEFLEGVTLGFEDFDLTAATDTLLVFAECMRSNGFDLPDPDFSLIDPQSGSIPTAGPFGDIDLQDPDFLAGFSVCGDLIADLGVGPPPTGSP